MDSTGFLPLAFQPPITPNLTCVLGSVLSSCCSGSSSHSYLNASFHTASYVWINIVGFFPSGQNLKASHSKPSTKSTSYALLFILYFQTMDEFLVLLKSITKLSLTSLGPALHAICLDLSTL